jgi:hypothetical protein
MVLPRPQISLKSKLPRPQLGINMWSQGSQAKAITQEVNALGDVVENIRYFNFDGVIQPLDPEEIKVKPAGQWSWDWYWFHTKEDVKLKTNDRVIYRNIEYKIMAVKDYADYGHIEYHCIRDWQNAT